MKIVGALAVAVVPAVSWSMAMPALAVESSWSGSINAPYVSHTRLAHTVDNPSDKDLDYRLRIKNSGNSGLLLQEEHYSAVTGFTGWMIVLDAEPGDTDERMTVVSRKSAMRLEMFCKDYPANIKEPVCKGTLELNLR